MVFFFRSRKGSVLLETAIALPILVALLLGMAEFGQAFMIKRRAAQVANTAADLVAQVSSVLTSDLNDIGKIGGEILKPYSATPLALRISCVMQNNSNATVQWSYSPLGTALPAYSQGKAYALPAGLAPANQAVIVAETAYAFNPTVGSFLVGGVTFSSTAYYKPRLSASVTLN